ncbi:MAG TPA: RNA 2'-phosphotransferase [Chloroflexota bacterium]|nr:RNA 2'-phosphotransferase [Chloroflexota bacterium]HUM68017.1 RNA 2'-phosphotransferase [Chloroflexota bacterium]
MQKRQVQISKFLSLVLRHRPEKIGLRLDEAGWTPVADLLQACNRHGFALSLAELQAVVANNDKARFSFNEDGSLIRANQGHSIAVNLGYEPVAPPEYLFHGTAVRFLAAIQIQGLLKAQRHHVHLSPDVTTARQVGQRHGREIILKVHSGAMHRDGHTFYRSANGVWLVEAVPPCYLEVIAA